MKNVAFVTYNTVGDKLSSGWHGSNGRRALVLQNSSGDRWAVDKFYRSDPASYRRSDHASHVMDEISNLWNELQTVLSEIDHIVVYVGSRGSEQAIALAAQLPASKVTFVGCDCGILVKEAMVQAAGLAKARRLLCECGGHRTMETLFESFMETGELLPVAA
ncbi:MAG: hypothetical protein AAB490_04230 [Patescibacteria group bacterium]